MKKIFVCNGPNYGQALSGLGEFYYNTEEFLENPQKFSLVQFTGGEDVSPYLYNDTSPKGVCNYSLQRDEEEVEVYEVAQKYGIACAGICRGFQFLNVMNGGKMMHHITGHAGSNHNIMDTNAREFKVTSTHHQMVIPGNTGHILAVSSPRLSDVYMGKDDSIVEYSGPEVESCMWPEAKCFGVQYHPEYMNKNSEGWKWYNSKVKRLLEV